jgi:hypothetical protein
MNTFITKDGVILGTIISVVYFILKFIEMKYVEKDTKPLKELVKDAIVVFFSVVFGQIIMVQLTPAITGKELNIEPAVFTDEPVF